ncbi:TAP-like protein-domain-containing protein [Dactylonectria estremocensis]|uniref:TAP-like protein-domain-containing protein n=1 Tax=Dactylonectria estremocensis TaxID=1079267 RepID=A0A9P9DW32_9HYPO|nr:TAP-like protein-domain-containing protein [Dactylonectria estremocensis]
MAISTLRLSQFLSMAIATPPGAAIDTLPFSCYATAEERSLATLVNPFLSGDSSDVPLGRIEAEAENFSQTCYHTQSETGELIGTAFVAKDMIRIVDALDEDGMLQFWGVSYSTLLGATAAAMFPERMDKVILDGGVNPFEYYSNADIRETELYTYTDAAFRGFSKACVASPDPCALATGNITTPELEVSIYAFFDDLKYSPIVVPDPTGGIVLEYSAVRPLIYLRLYFPSIWHTLDALLNALVTRDPETLAQLSTSGPALNAEAQFGIKCGDYNEVLATLERRHERSRIAGDTTDAVVLRCAKWKLPAKAHYTGDFDVETKNPMLIIGNTYNPVTPLASAKNVSETFKGSVLLQQDSHGHDSLTQASLWTAKAVSVYFVDGKLLDKNTVCSADIPMLTGSDGLGDVLKQLAAGEE